MATVVRAAAAVALVVGGLNAQAVASPDGLTRGDHEWALDAVRGGEIRPLTEILQRLEREFAGQVVEIELKRSANNVVYVIELLSPKGHLVELAYDARSGQLLSAEGRGLSSARRAERAAAGVNP
jgi:uncharacterized membrane protein YkoI